MLPGDDAPALPAQTSLSLATGVQGIITLAEPRSGSTYLVSKLAVQPETSYFYEECLQSRDVSNKCFETLKLPNTHPGLNAHNMTTAEVFMALMQKRPERQFATYTGFKLMIEQLIEEDQDGAVKFIEDHNIKVLSLVRTNVLRRCFSLNQMMTTSVATVHETYSQKEKVHVDPNFWTWCKNRDDMLEQKRREFLARLPQEQILNLEYEVLDAHKDETLAKISSFLGYQKPWDTSKDIPYKMHTGGLEDLIENWGETLPVLNKVFGAEKVQAWNA